MIWADQECAFEGKNCLAFNSRSYSLVDFGQDILVNGCGIVNAGFFLSTCFGDKERALQLKGDISDLVDSFSLDKEVDSSMAWFFAYASKKGPLGVASTNSSGIPYVRMFSSDICPKIDPTLIFFDPKSSLFTSLVLHDFAALTPYSAFKLWSPVTRVHVSPASGDLRVGVELKFDHEFPDSVGLEALSQVEKMKVSSPVRPSVSKLVNTTRLLDGKLLILKSRINLHKEVVDDTDPITASASDSESSFIADPDEVDWVPSDGDSDLSSDPLSDSLPSLNVELVDKVDVDLSSACVSGSCDSAVSVLPSAVPYSAPSCAPTPPCVDLPSFPSYNVLDLKVDLDVSGVLPSSSSPASLSVIDPEPRPAPFPSPRESKSKVKAADSGGFSSACPICEALDESKVYTSLQGLVGHLNQQHLVFD